MALALLHTGGSGSRRRAKKSDHRDDDVLAPEYGQG